MTPDLELLRRILHHIQDAHSSLLIPGPDSPSAAMSHLAPAGRDLLVEIRRLEKGGE